MGNDRIPMMDPKQYGMFVSPQSLGSFRSESPGAEQVTKPYDHWKQSFAVAANSLRNTKIKPHIRPKNAYY